MSSGNVGETSDSGASVISGDDSENLGDSVSGTGENAIDCCTGWDTDDTVCLTKNSSTAGRVGVAVCGTFVYVLAGGTEEGNGGEYGIAACGVMVDTPASAVSSFEPFHQFERAV